MAETYQDKIYRKQGAEVFVVASGGRIDFQSGGEFFLVDTTVLAQQLKLAFLSPITTTVWGQASLISGSVLVPAYGYHVFSAPTGISNGSVQIPAASKGAILYINGSYLIIDANVSCNTVSTVGKVVNARGSDLSSFEVSAMGFVQLACETDGTWTVVGQNNILEHASS